MMLHKKGQTKEEAVVKEEAAVEEPLPTEEELAKVILIFDKVQKDLSAWTKETLDSYAPGTINGKNLAKKLIDTFGDIIRIRLYPDNKERLGKTGKDEERLYREFFKKVKKDYKLKLPDSANFVHNFGTDGANAYRENEDSPGVTIYWGDLSATGKIAQHHANNSFGLIRIDALYFLGASRAERKAIFIHELQHAISIWADRWRSTGSRISEGFNFNPEDRWKANISSDTDQQELYNILFSYKSFPSWANIESEENLKKSLDYKREDFTLEEFYNKKVFSVCGKKLGAARDFRWATSNEERRAELKTLIQLHGEVVKSRDCPRSQGCVQMTESLFNKLCKEKQRAAEFDWCGSSTEEINKFLSSFEMIRFNMLLFLNCDQDPKAFINAANQLAKVELPAEAGSEAYAYDSSVTNKLIRLANALDSLGHIKEVNSLDGMIRYAQEDYWIEEQYIDQDGLGRVKLTNGEEYYYDPATPPFVPGERINEQDLIDLTESGEIHFAEQWGQPSSDLEGVWDDIDRTRERYDVSSESGSSEEAELATESEPTESFEEQRERQRVNRIRNIVNEWSVLKINPETKEAWFVKVSEFPDTWKAQMLEILKQPEELGYTWSQIGAWLRMLDPTKAAAGSIGDTITIDGIELLIIDVSESAPGKADKVTAREEPDDYPDSWALVGGMGLRDLPKEIYTFPSIRSLK